MTEGVAILLMVLSVLGLAAASAVARLIYELGLAHGKLSRLPTEPQEPPR